MSSGAVQGSRFAGAAAGPSTAKERRMAKPGIGRIRQGSARRECRLAAPEAARLLASCRPHDPGRGRGRLLAAGWCRPARQELPPQGAPPPYVSYVATEKTNCMMNPIVPTPPMPSSTSLRCCM